MPGRIASFRRQGDAHAVIGHYSPLRAHVFYTAHENARGNGICRRRGKMVEHQCVDIGGISNFGGLDSVV